MRADEGRGRGREQMTAAGSDGKKNEITCGFASRSSTFLTSPGNCRINPLLNRSGSRTIRRHDRSDRWGRKQAEESCLAKQFSFISGEIHSSHISLQSHHFPFTALSLLQQQSFVIPFGDFSLIFISDPIESAFWGRIADTRSNLYPL